MYRITATNHDSGANDATYTRETRERAEWSADLLRQCGYRTVEVDVVLSVGDRVICNGYPGAVRRVHEGQLAGMVDVAIGSGVVCVPARYPDCYAAN